MKKLTFLILFIIPIASFAQTVVKLSVNQPPEFGFNITNQDTTIVKGDSITLGNDLVVFGGSGEYIFEWSSGKTLSDSTILNPVAFPEDSTIYLLNIQDAFGCSFMLTYTVNVQKNPTIVPGGLNMNNTVTAKLFPNPSSGRFKVQLIGEPKDKIDLMILDNSGRVIKTQTVKNFTGERTETLQMKLPNGIYTLLISSENESLQRQFIIN